MLKACFFIILILSVTSAAVIGPQVYEQRDFGDISLDEFTYSISVDCDAATIRAIVMNESIEAVEGANTYLKYIDYASPLISSESTGKDGRVVHQLPGNVSLMRGLFILIIEKDGYRTKEMHFDILVCLTNQSYVPPRPEPPPQQPPPENVTNDSAVPPVPPNITETNITESEEANDTNATEADGVQDMPYSDLCPPAFLIPLLVLFKRTHAK